jgi:hypothetical protein
MDPGRNEPLLPRSASFNHPFDNPIAKATSIAASLHSCCQGEALAVKSACLLAATGSLTVGTLGVLSPFNVLSPLHLLTCLYLVPLSLGALALEVETPLLEPFCTWVASWMRVLTLPSGRAVFYIILGTLVAGLGDPPALLAGLLDVGAGVLALMSDAHDRTRTSSGPESTIEASRGRTDVLSDVPRLAFRRRLHYGMDRLDSAELVTLCLELGLSLDARARMAALAALDPHEEGRIEEEAFLAWWEQQGATAPRPCD